MTGATATGLEKSGEGATLKLRDERSGSERAITVDGVVAEIGIQPNVELAQMAGLEVDNGILVDPFLQTSHPDIYAAGDVASFYNPILQTRWAE